MSVYCGYCGQRGHNKLGCEERKKTARENPDGYLARQISREEETRRMAVSSRTCTYCDKPGHNRRGCKVLKEDKTLMRLANIKYQDDFAESLTTTGLGPGCLVKLPHGPYETPFEQHVIAMITEIDWNAVDLLNRDMSVSYSTTSRKVAAARVIKSVGWDPDAGTWRGPPTQNELVWIPLEFITKLAPQCFAEAEPFTAGRMKTLEVLSPSKFKNKRDPLRTLTNNINMVMRFELGHNPQRWEKSRIPLARDCWKSVYPEQHKAEKEKCLEWNAR